MMASYFLGLPWRRGAVFYEMFLVGVGVVEQRYGFGDIYRSGMRGNSVLGLY